MTKKLSVLIASLLLLAVFAASSNADIFYFNDSNAFGEWSGAIPLGYGSVKITETAAGLDFVVSANTAYFSSTTDPDLTWDKFFFNINGTATVETSNITITEPGNWNIKYEKNASDYGTFEFLLGGSAIGNSDINPLEFSVNLSGLRIADVAITHSDGWMFAGHLKRFDSMTDVNGDVVNSTFLGVGDAPAPVPEPATVVLFGTGLVGLMGVTKRKKK